MLNKIFIVISAACVVAAGVFASHFFDQASGNLQPEYKEEVKWMVRRDVSPTFSDIEEKNFVATDNSTVLLESGSGEPELKGIQKVVVHGPGSKKNRRKKRGLVKKYQVPLPSPPYGVHVGSFRSEKNARKLIESLKGRKIINNSGLVAVLDPFFVQNSEGFIRVVIGPFNKLDRARGLASSFRKNNEFAQVVHFPYRKIHASEKKTDFSLNPVVQVIPTENSVVSTASEVIPDMKPNLNLSEIVNGDMLMDVVLDRKVIYPAMLCAGRKGELYIPLSEIVMALEFPITISLDDKTASGWFLAEKRRFDLDLNRMTVVSDGKKISLDPNSVFINNDDIYILLDVFNEFFPLSLKPDYLNMQLYVDPEEPLPVQIRKRRAAERNLGNSGKSPLKYPLSNLDYDLVSPPRLDARASIGYNAGNAETDGFSTNFAGNYMGDLFFMSSSVFAQGSTSPNGNKESLIDNFTLLTERLVEDNDYLKKFSFGDVTPTDVVTVPGSGRERGFVFTNRDPKRGTDYGVKNFVGTTIPGWEVELYRNGLLVSFQTVGEDGRYAFEGIPLYYGKNNFKMVFYGTEGQQEERSESVTVDSSSIRPGEMVYETSLTQEDLDIWDPQDNPRTDDSGELRFRSKFSFGISENFSLSAGAVSETYEGARKNTGVAGVAIGMNGFLGQFDTSVNDNDGTSINGRLRGNVLDHNIQASFSRQFGELQADDPTVDSAYAGINSVLDLGNGTPLSYGVSLSRTHTETESGTENLYYTTAFSTGLSFDRSNISNNVSLKSYEISSDDESNEITGQLSASTYIEDLFLRASTSYDLTDDSPFSLLRITANKPIGRKMSVESGLSHDLDDNDSTKVYGQLNWSWGPFTLFNKLEYHDQGQVLTSLGFSTALDFEPHEGTPEIHKHSNVKSGGASVRVFLDSDYDGKFSKGDEPLKGVKVSASHVGQSAMTDDDGIAFFKSLAPMYATDIEVEEESLADPRLSPLDGGTAILPRKGRVYDIDIPVILTGEIEGAVVASTSGRLKSKTGVPLELVDEKGAVKKATMSSFDGHFYFSSVAPGKYFMRVNERYLSNYNFEFKTDGEVEIRRGEQALENYVVLIGRKGEKMNSELMDKAHNISDSSISEALIAALYNESEPDLGQETKTQNIALANPTSMRSKSSYEPEKKFNYPKIVINSFQSQKSVHRAMKFYRLKYSDALKGGALKSLKRTNDYILYVDFKDSAPEYFQFASKLDLTSADLQQTKELNSM